VEPLIEALKDESARVRYGAIESLDKIGDRRAVGPLIEALKDKGWLELPAVANKTGKGSASKKVWVRQRAIEALARFGDAGAVAPITDMLNDKHEAIRKSAQEALDKLNARSPAA
jgi:HEAT repeat protein